MARLGLLALLAATAAVCLQTAHAFAPSMVMNNDAPLAPAAESPLSQLAVAADGSFHDAAGRVVILRGVNVAHKVPDFTYLDESKADAYERFIRPLQIWGFNVVRLAFTMEAYVPQKGRPNLQYLASYRRMIEELASRGIYTVVDFHQDVFSRWTLTGCGEGFPEWMVPEATRATPADQSSVSDLYKKACPLWGLRSALTDNKELKQVYGPLYEIGNPVRNAFIDMAREVAESLKGLPSIVAYDMLNEPHVLTTNAKDIIPLYQDVARAIREADPAAVVMYEQIPGATASILENPHIENSVYSSHFYDLRTGIDLSLSQFEYWLKPNGLVPITSPFIDNILLQVSTSSKLLPVTKSAVEAGMDSLHELVVGLKAMTNLMLDQTVVALRGAPEDVLVDDDEDEDGSVASDPAQPRKRISLRTWVANQIAKAQASAIPKFWDHIENIEASTRDLSYKKPWSIGLSARLVSLIEGLRLVANELLFHILAPLLRRVLPLIGTSVAKDLRNSKNAAVSYGSAYVLGEFGMPPDATFLHAEKYMDDVYNAADKIFASAIQWGYTPDWSSATKDHWDMEDFSIVDNKLRPRANFLSYRPYPERTAGTPVALEVNYSKSTLRYTFDAQPLSEPSVFYFHQGGLCAKKKVGIAASPAGVVACQQDSEGHRVECQSLKAERVTVDLFCQ